MSVWNVRGGKPLRGEIRVQGSKNAVLPIMAASLLSPCESELINCPKLTDVDAAVDILRHLGCTAEQEDDTLRIDSHRPARCDIPRELMHRMRSSVIFLGPLLSRCGEAHVFVPGGCELGKRPIDLHLQAFRTLGAEVEQNGDEIVCRAGRLRGAEIPLRVPSVGATENAMIAACAAEGQTVIYNAAREPEIVALQEYLRQLGARIVGAGTPVISVTGFSPKERAAVRIPPDRIAAATYLCCIAVTAGEGTLRGAAPQEMELLLAALREMGCTAEIFRDTIHFRAPGRLSPPHAVTTRPYPGFATDAAPLFVAASACCDGVAVFIENIFEGRFRYTDELKKLGADIEKRGPLALVRGVPTLHGADTQATDLRGGAALITAALGADGETRIVDEGHISRGYEAPERVLSQLGADIWKE